MPLFEFASELILLIAEDLELSDLNALTQTCTRFFQILRHEMFRRGDEERHELILQWAARSGFQRVVEASLATGTRIDSKRPFFTDIDAKTSSRLAKRTQQGWRSSKGHQYVPTFTPLQVAIFHRQEEMACFLVRNGAHINEPSQDPVSKTTPLQLACVTGLPQLVQLLLVNGANPRKKDSFGRNTLHYAVMHSSVRPKTEDTVQIVALLLQKGVPITRDRFGNTLEHLMNKAGHPSLSQSSDLEEFEAYRPIDELLSQGHCRDVNIDGTALQAEKKIRALLEGHAALKAVAKCESIRDAQIKKNQIQQEAQIRLVNIQRQRHLQQCRAEMAEREAQWQVNRTMAESLANQRAAEESARREIERTSAEEARRAEVQAARIATWSRIKFEHSRAPTTTTCDRSPSSDSFGRICQHEIVGKLKGASKMLCRLCSEPCRGKAFICLDCEIQICHSCHQRQ